MSKELSLKGSGAGLRQKMLPVSFTKILRLNLVFMLNSTLRGKFNFCL